MPEKRVYNPFFLYARIAFKKTPKGYQYINWISDKWRAWDKASGQEARPRSKEDCGQFKEWLYKQVRG
ncbi:MAG TPA: hypothetical protein ENN55_01850 [Firmicutes bacterium]|nr:hypothetical protein [Bacillota bacterium]